MIPIRDINPTSRAPVVTLVLILTNVLIFLYQFTLDQSSFIEFVHQWGAIPAKFNPSMAEPEQLVAAVEGVQLGTVPPAVTLGSSMFLHGSWPHVLFNMLFLWIFGDNIEDRLGRVRFIMFYLVAGIVATGVHIYTNQGSLIPVVGASGAVAGVLGAYLVSFPKARVMTWFPPIFIFPVPAFVFLLVWIGMELVRGWFEIQGLSDSMVATWAHVGGFACGVILGIILSARDGFKTAKEAH